MPIFEEKTDDALKRLRAIDKFQEGCKKLGGKVADATEMMARCDVDDFSIILHIPQTSRFATLAIDKPSKKEVMVLAFTRIHDYTISI